MSAPIIADCTGAMIRLCVKTPRYVREMNILPEVWRQDRSDRDRALQELDLRRKEQELR